MPLAFLVDEYRLSPIQLPDILYLHVHHGLYNRTLGSQHDNLIIRIIERRTNSPGVTHAERFAATGQTADHKSAVPGRNTTFQHVRQIDMCLDRMSYIHPFQSFVFILLVQTFDLPVQTVSRLFEHDIRIGQLTRMLADRCNFFKDVIYVCEIEISAKSEVLGSPVVAA